MKQVLIIGGGLSGLVAAYSLQKAGISYHLIEARSRLGGRIHTVKTKDDSTLEMGATWFSDKHEQLISILKELGVPFEAQYQGKKVLYDYQNNGRVIQQVTVPEHTEESYIMSQGTSSLIEALFQLLDTTKILLDERVKSMTFDHQIWKVTTNKRILEADIIINTLPPNLFVNSIKINPDLPQEIEELSRQTHTWMGESINAGILFDKSPWRDKHIGSILSQYGPFTEIHDHIHQNNSTPILKGFIHNALHDLTKEQRKPLVEQQLALYFQNQDLDILQYLETDWQNETLTYFPYENELVPHQNNGHPLFRESLYDGYLFFAGSETADDFPGYMEGAVDRALEVSHIIIQHFSRSLIPNHKQ